MTSSRAASAFPWERPLGARQVDANLTEFRVWAPHASRVAVRVNDSDTELHEEGFAIYSGVLPAPAGTDYWLVLDGEPQPDPASRWQPHGLRGCSRVFSAARPRPLPRPLGPAQAVLYEMHVGTFTEQGTFSAAIEHLEALAQLGVTAIELMPIAEFPGARGWGYDGVFISAAQSSYGGPEQLLELVDAAHAHGLAVILDVVYNHVGISGLKTLEAFGPYFTEKYGTPWGKAMNFDDELCDPVREWVLQSAESWIRDYGIDGLRLDAVHAIHDSSAEHIVAAISRRVHAADRAALVTVESGLNDPKVVEPAEDGGWGADAVWADDFHHALWVLLTGEHDGYYVEFGQLALLAKAFHRPHVHDGTYSSFRKRRFGAPADQIAPERFIVFSQNHDQVGNRAFGDRMPRERRALAALITLLSPFTPMLFMGEEYGEDAPFQFFCDHIDPELADATRNGRREEFAAFASFKRQVPDPQAATTFLASKLTHQRDPFITAFYRQLLRVRAQMPGGDAGAVSFDEDARCLRVTRGEFEIVANFASGAADFNLPEGSELILTSDLANTLSGESLKLKPLSGALIRHSCL